MDKLYFIWIQLVLGIANPRVRHIVDTYESVELFYDRVKQSDFRDEVFTDKEIVRLKATPLDEAQKVLEHCKNRGYNVITPGNPLYSAQLLLIENLPAVLYTDGDIGFLNETLCIGIVGTRRATTDGTVVTKRLSYRLATAGASIISTELYGGLDCDALMSAALAGAHTAIILPAGLDRLKFF